MPDWIAQNKPCDNDRLCFLPIRHCKLQYTFLHPFIGAFHESQKGAKDIIQRLEGNRFYAECPCCGEPILLKDAGLFYFDDFSPEAEGLYQSLRDRSVP
jgi:hypothetical protein